MSFCGQCGLQLAPGSTTCPRCGAVTERDLSPSMEELHSNDPTIVSLPQPEPYTPQPNMQRPGSISSPTPPPQQKLILRPGRSDPGFATPDPNDPTKMMTAPVSPSNPNVRTSYPEYPLQSGSNYASQRTANFPPTQYAGPQPQPVPGQLGATPLPTQSPPRKGRGRLIVLTTILIVLLVIASVMAVFVAQPALLRSFLGNNPTPTPDTPAAHGRAVMQRYYDDINNKNYQDAYNLWGNGFHQQRSYDDFAAGYAHTEHDDLTIDRIVILSSHSVRMFITIVATEDTGSGTIKSTYKGIYIVGQEDGEWKILSGTFQKVA